ncbi:MAG: hypothetical protein JWP19_675 [Rhodoglobus sp.]|nr:hypothetical protein [Rhodoglobus sp.]
MTCPTCGNPVRPGATFCGECGSQLPTAAAAVMPPPPPPPPPPAPTSAPAPVLPSVEPPARNPFLIGVPPSVTPAPAVATAPVAAAPSTDTDIEATRVSARRSSRAGWTLELSDGQRLRVTTSALVGRGPAADPRWPGAILVQVVDSTKTVSKTHAVFEVVDGSLWVTDLNSSNGVFIEGADGTEHDVDPGVRIVAPSGSSVLLGDFPVKVDKG